jgi:hypothetical protein
MHIGRQAGKKNRKTCRKEVEVTAIAPVDMSRQKKEKKRQNKMKEK